MMCKSGYIVILWATILASVGFLHAQDNVILQFTGQDQNGGYVKLDRVLVENISKHWQELLYYPDTTFIMGITRVEESHGGGEGVRLAQNVPNPFDGVTDFSLYLPNSSKVLLEVYDLNGKISAAYTGSLDPRNHQFRAWLDNPQTYLLQAHTVDGMVQIKMVNTGHAGRNSIEYLGKTIVQDAPNGKGGTNQPFSYGDLMSYKGYVYKAGLEFESVPLTQEQYYSEEIRLNFSLPLPTVTTAPATNITTAEAQLNGSVTGMADYPVLERGFILADNMELTGAVTYTDGAGDGSFQVTVPNLQVSTQYFYRAYCQTAMGVTCGTVIGFVTQAELPEVHTLQVTDIKASRATCGGNVTYSGGAYITARGVCYSTSPNPTLSDNYTTSGNGDGSFTSLITGLIADTTYYVRAYATNSVGTTYGEQLIFTTQPPFYCGIDTLTDYDGNVYHTVEIGQQCWMKENLRTIHYADGSIIPVGTELSETTAYRYYPNDNSANVPIYGYLYNWAAVMHGAASSSANPSGVQGICPDGWHVPSEAELMQLINFVSSQSQYGCGGDNSNIVKALSSAMGWRCVSTNNVCYADFDISLNNATGFSAIPIGHAGSGYCEFGFVDYKQSCCIRSSTEHFGYNGTHGAATLEIRYDGVNIRPYIVCYATSVRCLLDDSGVDSSIAVTPLVTTVKIEDITSMSARTGGFVSGSGGTPVTSRGVCWSTTPNPTVNNGHTFDGDGAGGYTSGIAGLAPGTTYYIRAYAINSAGTAYGEQRVFTTTHPINDNILIDAQTCPGADTVTDYDGNLYHTLQLGQQCWLKENLRTTHYADGTAIAPGSSSSLTVPYRYAPWGQDSNVPLYGYLYNWAAVMRGDSSSNANPSGVQGVCPTGWHVPSLSEWEQLVSYVGGQPQYVCGSDSSYIAKALASEIGWYESTNACAPGNERYTNNATGFSALPAGYYLAPSESYLNLTSSSVFWSSYSDTFQLQNYKSGATVRNFGNSGYAFSVRCLRN